MLVIPASIRYQKICLNISLTKRTYVHHWLSCSICRYGKGRFSACFMQRIRVGSRNVMEAAKKLSRPENICSPSHLTLPTSALSPPTFCKHWFLPSARNSGMCIACGVKHAHGTWQVCPDRLCPHLASRAGVRG